MALRILCDGLKSLNAGHLGVGIGDIAPESFSPKNDHETMLLDRLDKDLDTRNLDLSQRNRKRRAFLTADTARSSVGDPILIVDRAKIATNRNVLWLQLKADPRSLQCTPTDQVLKRVVTKKSQVTRSASGRDPWLDRNTRPLNTQARQRVQMRCFGRLKLGQSARMHRQSTEPIGHQHHNFTAVIQLQFSRQRVNIHRLFETPNTAGESKWFKP